MAGKRNSDNDILATKLSKNGLLVTFSSDHKLKGWNLKTGKFIMKIIDFQVQDIKFENYTCKILNNIYF